ncbi:MAG: toll/interleukin-1 receptor domain-containing protein [Thermodesulfobacteriota bacterium]
MHDIFICHASEDKEEVAKPVAEWLTQLGVSVWYDEFSLTLGDSLRRCIDKGLASSRYGLVILSPSFFSKEWPQTELNGLVAKEIEGQKTILPVWHKISRREVLEHSPILADKVAAKTSEGLPTLIKRIVDAITPEGFAAAVRKIVTANPTCIDLIRGDYSVNNVITVSNLSERPVYSVKVKLTLVPETVDVESVSVKVDEPNKMLEETFSGYTVSLDNFILKLLDSRGREVIVVIFHHIDPRTSRHISVSGTPPNEGQAMIQVWDFELEPCPVIRKDHEIAVIMKFPGAKEFAMCLSTPAET